MIHLQLLHEEPGLPTTIYELYVHSPRLYRHERREILVDVSNILKWRHHANVSIGTDNDDSTASTIDAVCIISCAFRDTSVHILIVEQDTTQGILVIIQNSRSSIRTC